MQELRSSGVDIAEVPRGGEVTFHGPGQLVVYPIAGIRELRVGARAWVEGLERCIVRVASHFGVEARVRRRPPKHHSVTRLGWLLGSKLF